jgi:hypothetical protein
MYDPRWMTSRVLVVCMLIVSCAEPTATPTTSITDRVIGGTNEIPDGYVATPEGLYHRSCVIEIPDGAVLRYDGVVIPKKGAKYKVPMTCSYPVLHSASNTRAAKQAPIQGPTISSNAVANPTLSGFLEEAAFQPAHHLLQVTADWRVPTAPIVFAQQAYFNFPGLAAAGSYILQPVVQFGVSGAGGGPYWSMTAWKCGLDGGPCFHYGALKKVNSGDLIHGTVVGSNCIGSICHWLIGAVDQTTGTSFSQAVIDSQYYVQGEGGDVEVKNTSSCSQIPVNGVTYTNIAFVDENSTHLTPSFAHIYGDTASLPCGYLIASTLTTVQDFHNASSDTVSANGGLDGITGCTGLACSGSGFISSISASGSTLTLKNKYGATGIISLHGATAVGTFTASCSGLCTGPQPITTVTVSGKVITLKDGIHTGTITLSGATFGALSMGQTAFCTGLACGGVTQITEFSSWGANGISTISDSHGNSYYIKFQ